MSNDSLDIIARQIKLLKEKKELDYSDTKRLEILIKMQRLILEKPTEIIRQDDEIYTDLQVLRAIKKQKPKEKKVTKKKATNGKKKKTTSRSSTSN